MIARARGSAEAGSAEAAWGSAEARGSAEAWNAMEPGLQSMR
jgi:hypothetical protein